MLGVLPIEVSRNAYGRQLASSIEHLDIPILNLQAYPAYFIRAPRIEHIGVGVSVHAHRGYHPVFVQKGRAMATTFHPELASDPASHRFFLSI
jgi:5'-phosphate synthase pdxT subunit